MARTLAVLVQGAKADFKGRGRIEFFRYVVWEIQFEYRRSPSTSQLDAEIAFYTLQKMGRMAKQKKTFTREECEKFVDAANPHQWLLSADSLHGQALALWRNRGREQLALKRDGHPTLTWDMTNKATFLLAAFAMENMLKAFLVFEFPGHVGDGYLKGIASHDLAALADKSSLIPYKARDRWVFEAFAEGNESWMRYPCGRNADDVEFEQQFSIKLWLKYCDMMKSYTIKMKRLLAKGWTGPYGPYGNWTFDGEF